jgi:small subunit ribosomal protein S12e
VEDRPYQSYKKLGEWAGLCKIDKDGLPRKVCGASCVVVTNFGDENEGLAWLQANEFK